MNKLKDKYRCFVLFAYVNRGVCEVSVRSYREVEWNKETRLIKLQLPYCTGKGGRERWSVRIAC